MERNSFIFHLLVSCYWLSPSSGLQLQRALGVSSTYKPGSSTVRLVWQLHPSNADIFYVKCNHSTSVNSSSEVLTYTWNNSRAQFRPTLEGWGTAEHNRTSFVITVKNPRENDVGWYRCIFNTQQSRDIQGTVQLDRMLDALQFVQGVHRNFTLYDDYASLILTIHPPSSHIQEVTCLPERGNMQRETFWCKQDAQRNWSSNSSRVTCILHDSYFELVVAEPSRNDQGAYNCYFISKTSTKNGIASLSLQQNSERGLKPEIIAGITIPSVICLLLLIMVIAVLVYYFRRRRKQSITKQSSSQNTIRFKNRASIDETDQQLLNPVVGQNLERQNKLEGELKQAKECIAELEQKKVEYDNYRKISDQMKADLEKRYQEVIEKHTVERNEQKNELERYRLQSEQMTTKANDIKEELEKRNTEVTQMKAEVDRLNRVIEELENEEQRKKNKTNHQVNTAEVDQVDHGFVNRQKQKQAEQINKLTSDLKEKENEYVAVQGKLEVQIIKNQTQLVQINQLQSELTEAKKNFDKVQSKLEETKRKHKEKKQEVQKLQFEVNNMPNTVVLMVRKKIVETFQAKEQYGREEILNRISNILFECIEDARYATEKGVVLGKHRPVDEYVEKPAESPEALGVRPHAAASSANGAGNYSGGGTEPNYAPNADSFSADSATRPHDSDEMIRLGEEKGKPPKEKGKLSLPAQATCTSPNSTSPPTENTSPPADWTGQGSRPSIIQQSIGLPPEGTGGGEAHTEGGSHLNSPTDDRDDPLAEPAAIHQKENSNR